MAAELSRRGYIATVTLRNTRRVDVLAANSSGTRTATIQVKTNQHSNREWLLSAKSDTSGAPGLFYVFVNLNGNGKPTFHVVDSKKVARYTVAGHQQWLSKSKRDGTPRKDTSMRKFSDERGKYLNAWHRLKLDDPKTRP